MANSFDYSQTPASNNSAPPDGSPEDQAPSSVNNVIRKMMANIAGAFNCYTAGGTANAQTVTLDPALTAYSTKVRIAFIPVADNTGACTLAVNGLTATSIKLVDGSDPYAGALDASGIALVQYDGTNFVLLNAASGFRGCLLYKSAAQSIATGLGTPVDLTWDSEEYDTSSFHDTVTNNERITIPAGVSRVRLTAGVVWASNSTGNRAVTFNKTGSTFRGGSSELDVAISSTMAMHISSAVVTVTSGNYFTVTAAQDSGGALNVNAENRTFFALEVIE